jgi:hypothetical protein
VLEYSPARYKLIFIGTKNVDISLLYLRKILVGKLIAIISQRRENLL